MSSKNYNTRLQISLTIDIPDQTKTAQLDAVLNSNNIDIIESVKEFCAQEKIELNTQLEIEAAINKFVDKYKDSDKYF